MTKDLTSRQEGKLWDRDGDLWGTVSGPGSFDLSAINYAEMHRLVEIGLAEVEEIDEELRHLKLMFGAMDLLEAWDRYESMARSWENTLEELLATVKELARMREDAKSLEALLDTKRRHCRRLQRYLALSADKEE